MSTQITDPTEKPEDIDVSSSKVSDEFVSEPSSSDMSLSSALCVGLLGLLFLYSVDIQPVLNVFEVALFIASCNIPSIILYFTSSSQALKAAVLTSLFVWDTIFAKSLPRRRLCHQ